MSMCSLIMYTILISVIVFMLCQSRNQRENFSVDQLEKMMKLMKHPAAGIRKGNRLIKQVKKQVIRKHYRPMKNRLQKFLYK